MDAKKFGLYALGIITIFLLFYQCSKDSDEETQTTTTETTTEYITTTETTTEEATSTDATNTDSEEIDYDSLSEDEYKALCSEKWREEIFFSEEDLKGQYVKLDIFLEENYYFEADAIYTNDIVMQLVEDYNIGRVFYKCGVAYDAETIGYGQGQINLYFSSDYEYTSTDFELGDHLTVYGQIVEYSDDTWEGYNYCSVIPKYIINNGQ